MGPSIEYDRLLSDVEYLSDCHGGDIVKFHQTNTYTLRLRIGHENHFEDLDVESGNNFLERG